MIKRKMHDATHEELQRSVDAIDEDLETIRQRISRTSYRDAVSIGNISFSLLQEWKRQEAELTERKNDLLLQIKERRGQQYDV